MLGTPIGSNRLHVYLPDTDKKGNVFDASDWVNHCATLLTKHFQGATVLPPARGVYKAGDLYIYETTFIIYSYCTDITFHKARDDIRFFLDQFIAETNQDTVAVEYDGTMYLYGGRNALQTPLENHPQTTGGSDAIRT